MLNSIVTGGLQGIGKAIAHQLKKRGDKVFVFDCVQENDQRVEQLKKNEIEYFQVDVSSTESIKNGFSKVFQILDSQNLTLDVLVNNAGITRDGIAIRMSEKDWDDVLSVNLKGAFFCAQQALKRMMRNPKSYIGSVRPEEERSDVSNPTGASVCERGLNGCSYIINISSIVGISGNAGQTNYAASKAGIIAMTKSLAAEYGSRNILVNAIAPGFIQTEMTAKLPEKVKEEILKRISLKRLGQPKDVALAVDFLTSGNADYITGSIIDLNGGLF